MSETNEIKTRASRAAGKPGKHLVISSIGDRELHRDEINLNSAWGRDRFIDQTMKAAFGNEKRTWPAGQIVAIQAQLLESAQVPPGESEPKAKPLEQAPNDPRVAALAATPEEVRDAADKYLREPKLLQRIVADIEALGVVGEMHNKAILYLVGTSAQLPRPLAVITRGASSSGKSFVLEHVATLFPPESVLHATSLTTNALYYFPPGALRHLWIVAGERSRVEDDGQAEATRALREMIEAGRLSKALPVKIDDRWVTEVIKQEGPIAYAETTTLGNVFEEDANRCILLNTDEGAEQTKRILEATARVATGESRADLHQIRQVHHAIQRMIPRTDVIIPFAPAIACCYPSTRLESRRDIRHLLQLVKASALLHFLQRERDEKGQVVAAFDDYAVAERLARGPLGAAATGVSDSARQFLDKLSERFGEKAFTTTDATKLGGAQPRTLRRRIESLNAAGSLEQTDAPRGRIPAKWRITGVVSEACASIIPSLREVQEAWAVLQRADKQQTHTR